jgi:hypothetical protein
MSQSDREKAKDSEHKGPNPGLLAIVFTILFNAGLYFVVSFSPDHFPGPWDSGDAITTYFRGHPHNVLMCAFLQFGSAIPLGLLTATIVSRLRFLGIKAAGVHIALFGGLMTALNVALSSLVLWVMAYPGIAQDASLTRALYYLVYAVGGVGYSVPLGLLMAGVSIAAGIMRLLPKWLVALGILLAICGELSWFSLLSLKLLFLIPLTRFPGFIWLIATGFFLPKAVRQKASVGPGELRVGLVEPPA